jgi:hypothetical protein
VVIGHVRQTTDKWFDAQNVELIGDAERRQWQLSTAFHKVAIFAEIT